MMHSDNRRTSAIAMALFATGVAVSVLLIATHNRPFTGEISVVPDPLLQVLPEGKSYTEEITKSVPADRSSAVPCCFGSRPRRAGRPLRLRGAATGTVRLRRRA